MLLSLSNLDQYSLCITIYIESILSVGSEVVIVCTNISISLIDMEVDLSSLVARGAQDSVSGV